MRHKQSRTEEERRNTGEKLVCTQGNDFYSEGKTYTVGKIVNDKYFQVLTASNDDHWYATLDDNGIYVSFDSVTAKSSKARFDEISDKSIV
ncbi:hypothetical protein [Psychrobacter sp. LV10R520-6]|uniref:hypothetical protein n=1 Tax=Psychrobacter sp. LV10R520-6 TaxID=1415574 RepID=UPI0024CD8524|nr:hypothetical protein [Psychrobacter sp. LV10R520-6]SNT70015.1 hypothetical protein SAMN04488491_1146 [Psychrobacter sp. LV10R520-6]